MLHRITRYLFEVSFIVILLLLIIMIMILVFMVMMFVMFMMMVSMMAVMVMVMLPVILLLQLLLHLDHLRYPVVHLLDGLELGEPHPLAVADVVLAALGLAVLARAAPHLQQAACQHLGTWRHLDTCHLQLPPVRHLLQLVHAAPRQQRQLDVHRSSVEW